MLAASLVAAYFFPLKNGLPFAEWLGLSCKLFFPSFCVERSQATGVVLEGRIEPEGWAADATLKTSWPVLTGMTIRPHVPFARTTPN